jgi:hypothetical protein
MATETALPHVNLQLTCDFAMSPMQAREEVIALLVRNMGLAIYAGEPTRFRVENGRMCWLVPVFVSLPHHDSVGPVEWIPVDAHTGKTDFSADDIAALREKTTQIIFSLDPDLKNDWDRIRRRRAEPDGNP